MTTTEIKVLRVLGIRAKDPGALVTVNGHLVRWSPRRGWNCDCLTDLDEYECDHITVVRDMLDERVTTPLTPQRPRFA